LEQAILEVVAKENWPGFRIDCLRVKKRENTGVGRYVHFDDLCNQALVDGHYSSPERLIEMHGATDRLQFEIAVSSSRIDYLEIVTSGEWDGTERLWKIV